VFILSNFLVNKNFTGNYKWILKTGQNCSLKTTVHNNAADCLSKSLRGNTGILKGLIGIKQAQQGTDT